MSDGLNRWTGIGNLAADPELRAVNASTVLKFRIACTESFVGKNDQRQERTEFVSCTLWGKRGEALAKFMSKGIRVCVEGSLRTNTYEKNGEKRYSTEINVTNVILAGGGQRGDAGGRGGSGGGRREQQHEQPRDPALEGDGFGGSVGDDDNTIPF